MIGYSIGTGLGGPVAIWLIPKFGWKSVFVFGGAFSLVCAGVLFLILPESIRFLVSKGQAAHRIAPIVRRIAPGQIIPAGASFIVSDEVTQRKDFRPSLLFRGELRLDHAAHLAGLHLQFTRRLLHGELDADGVRGAPVHRKRKPPKWRRCSPLMGAAGGLLLMRFTDKRGAIAITVMPVGTMILLLTASFVPIGHTPFMVLIAVMGGFLIGGHFGLHSICGIFYPSAYRANGAGWATSVAKIGSVAGPILGGIILSTSLPVRHIFAVLAVCPAIFAICIYAVGRMHRRILGREALAATTDAALTPLVAR